jgi:hypothetical protein
MTDSLWRVPLMSKKIMIMILIFLFICLLFFDLCEFGLSVYGLRFISRTLVKSIPGPLLHFFLDLHKIWCCTFPSDLSPNLVNISMSI